MQDKRRAFSSRQVLLIAFGVGLAVAIAPLAVQAATSVVRMAGKKNRVVAVSKKGLLSVSVRNQPRVTIQDGASVKVPDGVAIRAPQALDVNVRNHPAETTVQPSFAGAFNVEGM